MSVMTAPPQTGTDLPELTFPTGLPGLDGLHRFALVRLDEVADVRLAAENERSLSRSNGVPGISIGVEQISKANTLEVARGVRAEVERLRPDLPPGTRLEINLDRSVFIEE